MALRESAQEMAHDGITLRHQRAGLTKDKTDMQFIPLTMHNAWCPSDVLHLWMALLYLLIFEHRDLALRVDLLGVIRLHHIDRQFLIIDHHSHPTTIVAHGVIIQSALLGRALSITTC